MILVTGAAGKTGQAVIGALTERAAPVRALLHRVEQVGTVEDLGAQDITIGDMLSRDTLAKAVRGTRAVYHICPNVHPEEVAIGMGMIDAAQSAGIEHFVYHSVLHPQTEEMPHHWRKLRVEERLLTSQLPYTILQPAVYMQNLLSQWRQIIEDGIYEVPYGIQSRLSMVDLRDVAHVAALVLTEPGHAGATYELVGAPPLTQSGVAEIISRQLGRPVHARSISPDTWKKTLVNSPLGEDQIKTLITMFEYYDSYGLGGSPQILTWLLGRPPTSLAEFIENLVRDRSDVGSIGVANIGV